MTTSSRDTPAPSRDPHRPNIPLYLIGAAHRHKTDAQRLIEAALVDGVRLVSDAEVETAKAIVLGRSVGGARDAHLAVMRRHGICRIMTFDQGFDGQPGIERLR